MNANTTTRRYAVTDGTTFATGMPGYIHPTTFSSADEAQNSIQDLCWHPARWDGPFRVEEVLVTSYIIAGDTIVAGVSRI